MLIENGICHYDVKYSTLNENISRFSGPKLTYILVKNSIFTVIPAYAVSKIDVTMMAQAILWILFPEITHREYSKNLSMGVKKRNGMDCEGVTGGFKTDEFKFVSN